MFLTHLDNLRQEKKQVCKYRSSEENPGERLGLLNSRQTIVWLCFPRLLTISLWSLILVGFFGLGFCFVCILLFSLSSVSLFQWAWPSFYFGFLGTIARSLAESEVNTKWVIPGLQHFFTASVAVNEAGMPNNPFYSATALGPVLTQCSLHLPRVAQLHITGNTDALLWAPEILHCSGFADHHGMLFYSEVITCRSSRWHI